jgi:hypothetical protein
VADNDNMLMDIAYCGGRGKAQEMRGKEARWKVLIGPVNFDDDSFAPSSSPRLMAFGNWHGQTHFGWFVFLVVVFPLFLVGMVATGPFLSFPPPICQMPAG